MRCGTPLNLTRHLYCVIPEAFDAVDLGRAIGDLIVVMKDPTVFIEAQVNQLVNTGRTEPRKPRYPCLLAYLGESANSRVAQVQISLDFEFGSG